MLGALSPAPLASSRLGPPLTNHGVRMDSLHAIGFYVSAALAGVGGLLLAFLRGHWRRGAALALTGIGVAGIYASLSAGFAAVVGLVCYAACALLVARPDYRTVEQAVGGYWSRPRLCRCGAIRRRIRRSASRAGRRDPARVRGALGGRPRRRTGEAGGPSLSLL